MKYGRKRNLTNIIKWKRSDNGNVEYWVPMAEQLAIIMKEWDAVALHNCVLIAYPENTVTQFTQKINEALSRSLDITKNRPVKVEK